MLVNLRGHQSPIPLYGLKWPLGASAGMGVDRRFEQQIRAVGTRQNRHMRFRGGSRASAVVFAALLCAACTHPLSPSSSRSSSSAAHVGAATTTSVPSEACPDVTGQSEVASGHLKAGPFSLEATQAPRSKLAKMWVSSTRPGRDEAQITVTRSDGSSMKTTRPAGEASIPTVAQFWPGVVGIPEAGLYRITVHAGTDSMCVHVRFSEAS